MCFMTTPSMKRNLSITAVGAAMLTLGTAGTARGASSLLSHSSGQGIVPDRQDVVINLEHHNNQTSLFYSSTEFNALLIGLPSRKEDFPTLITTPTPYFSSPLQPHISLLSEFIISQVSKIDLSPGVFQSLRNNLPTKTYLSLFNTKEIFGPILDGYSHLTQNRNYSIPTGNFHPLNTFESGTTLADRELGKPFFLAPAIVEPTSSGDGGSKKEETKTKKPLSVSLLDNLGLGNVLDISSKNSTLTGYQAKAQQFKSAVKTKLSQVGGEKLSYSSSLNKWKTNIAFPQINNFAIGNVFDNPFHNSTLLDDKDKRIQLQSAIKNFVESLDTTLVNSTTQTEETASLASTRKVTLAAIVPDPRTSKGTLTTPKPTSLDLLAKNCSQKSKTKSLKDSEARVCAFLDTISWAETGTSDRSTSYTYIAFKGADRIKNFSTHPFVDTGVKPSSNCAFIPSIGRRLCSSASGRYQVTDFNFQELKSKGIVKDFSPISQDAIALYYIKNKGALNDVLEGRFEKAVCKVGNVWASFPCNSYNQPQKVISKLKEIYQKQLDKY